MDNFFSLPDKQKDQQSYTVFVLTILWTVTISFTVSIGFIYFPHLGGRWTTIIISALLIAALTTTLNRVGLVKLASLVLTTSVWLLITVPCYSAGGVMAPGILTQMSVILTAGFLLGWRGGLAIGLLTIGTDFWFAYLEVNGNLPNPTVVHTPITRWIGGIIPFGTILGLQYYSTNHLRTSLILVQNEVKRREKAEEVTRQTVHNLKERVKELNTLNQVSRILHDEDESLMQTFQKIVEVLPAGWQYPDITAARILFAGTEYITSNFQPSGYSQKANAKTQNGSTITLEIVYLEETADIDEGPFLNEERNLINMLAEMIGTYLDRRERRGELKDYKYALDVGYMVSISGADERFTYVNDNFCKVSKYSAEELLSNHYGMIMSGHHPAEYFTKLGLALQSGASYRGEFCNKAKDGTLYWVDTTIVPFLDENSNVYQFLTINHDITERKLADEKAKQSDKLLRKITSQVPGNTYMFEIEESGATNIIFLSRGTDAVENPSKHPEVLREVVHIDDRVKFNDAMKAGYLSLAPISFNIE